MLPLYVDFDDVISETTLSFIEILKREYGRDVCLNQVTTFNFKDAFGLSQTEFEYLFNLIHQPDEILRYKPVGNVQKCGHGINVGKKSRSPS